MRNSVVVIHQELNNQPSMKSCKQKLARLWFAAGAILFLVLTLQTMFGKYGDEAAEAWGWLLPAVLPTLSLIMGVLIMDVHGRMLEPQKADSFLFRLAYWLSAIYLLATSLTVLMQPFVSTAPIALMSESKLWLGPLQGLVSGSMGAFFVRRKG